MTPAQHSDFSRKPSILSMLLHRDTAPGGGATARLDPAGGKLLRVLVIDEDVDDAHRAMRALREAGVRFVADHVDGLSSAERATRDADYDLVLVDLSLEKGLAYSVVRRTRALAPRTPIVALTECDTESTLREALEADADDFLPKADVDAASLGRAIRHARERRRLALHIQSQQEEIGAASEQMSRLVSAVSDGIAVLDEQGTVVFANAAFAAMMGSSADEVVGSVRPDIPRDGTAIIDVAYANGGSPARHFEAVSVPIVWDGVAAYVATLRDVTERREVEERLQASQRIDAIGQLAGGMAHEVNNVLAVVLSNVALLKDRTADREALSLAEDIERGARRGTALLSRLLAVGRRQRLSVGTIDLGAVVADLADTLRAILPIDLELEIRVPSEIVPAKADEAAIEQILLNLVTNAREATPRGGKVEIVVERTDVAGDRGSERHRDMSPGPYVRMDVRDHGIGMDADTLSMAFEPFFTTKERDEGTGLGLSTVYGLTRQLGGFAFLGSEPGAGTTVSLYFPLLADHDVSRATTAPEKSLLGSGETILVVEDEESLRRATTRVLERLGYQVVEAENGREALDVLRRRSGEVDLVLSDVVMPVLGGHGMYRAMQEVDQRPPVLFVSGYSAEDLRDGDLLDPSFDLLQKPWGISELQDGIRRALGAGATTGGELVGGHRY